MMDCGRIEVNRMTAYMTLGCFGHTVAGDMAFLEFAFHGSFSDTRFALFKMSVEDILPCITYKGLQQNTVMLESFLSTRIFKYSS